MTIPKHNEIRVPALKLLSESGRMDLCKFEEPLAEHFSLTPEEIQQKYESGNGKIFYDRIGWALSYMNIAGLVQKPRRGVYEISELGVEKLATPSSINDFIDAEYSKRQRKRREESQPVDVDDENLTPQEELYESSRQIRETQYQEIIDTILSKTPREFEKLVVTLLNRMGYGGEIKQSSEVTPYTNDQGIDGIIKEDVLGLGRIYIQAKRYRRSNKVGREEIQKFVGALAVVQSSKGVIITTSSFSPGAEEYAMSLNGSASIVLIDGGQLAEYIYNYGLGLQVEQTIEIKKLDSEFWDSMENDVVPNSD